MVFKIWVEIEQKFFGGDEKLQIIDCLLRPEKLSTGESTPGWSGGGVDVWPCGRCGVISMSDRGSGTTEAVVPFAAKSNARADPNDPLEKAGHLILDMIRQAAGDAQASNQQTVETSRKLSAQLRGAEDRMKELETKLRYQEDRADRAERWLHQVSVEIEEKFFGRDKAASRS